MNLSQGLWKLAMLKIIYDVIQRFEVENGVPRLISTNIQVIQGGEDLLSLAINMLERLGFYDKFEENRTSQYIGYRLKNPGKGAKRYQLVLAQRKEGLCISIPKNVFQQEILELTCETEGILIDRGDHFEQYKTNILGRFWVLPSKEDIFLDSMQVSYPNSLKGEVQGSFSLNSYENYIDDDGVDWGGIVSMSPEEFKIEHLGDISSYLIIHEDKLFPYAWQVCIGYKEVLEEFISYFAKILMEQQ
ncbi:MAG: hypothetical protein KME32_08440 [Mojavia pulchra JT2-VF2]|uniref:Uncharacterized protein n=1 Tax=Mojavia pulchra JT2-VF2 TaxID=287848 RepID=A0A951PYD2_9NOST|nr:hypothetical protein [Mojavia pulchra JT2-VF2]